MARESGLLDSDAALSFMLFVSIGLVLILVHYLLPDTMRGSLVFDHSRPSLYSIWSSAFVHLNQEHLVKNLIGFTTGTLGVWLIFDSNGWQRLLRRFYVLLLIICPVIVSFTSYISFQYYLGAEKAASRGFSGIVAAVFGLLVVSTIELIYEEKGPTEVVSYVLSLTISVMVLMLHFAGALTPRILFAGILGVALSASLALSSSVLKEFPSTVDEKDLLIIASSLMLLYALPQLFPIQWVNESNVVNIFGHGAGLIWGIISGVVTIAVARKGDANLKPGE